MVPEPVPVPELAPSPEAQIEEPSASAPSLVTIAEKQVADAASSMADKTVAHLESARDEAWRNARGSLSVASCVRCSRTLESVSHCASALC